jgi:Uma2 family endonuclease
MNSGALSLETGTPSASQATKLSYETFLEQLDEDTRAEWVNGEVLIMSPVSNRHQRVGRFLLSIMSWYIELNPIGELFYESFQMKTGPDLPGREPDIIFLSNENSDRIRHSYIDGPGDLVVEIVSLDSRKRDRADKFYEYEQGGVREYWLIDPLRSRAEFYFLDVDGKYLSVPVDEHGFYASTVLPGLKIKPEWMWQEPLPSLMSALKASGIAVP